MSYFKEWAQICKGVNRGDYSLFETDATPEELEKVRRIEAVFTHIPRSAAILILERVAIGQSSIDPILMESLRKFSDDCASINLHLNQRIKWLESATVTRPSTSDFVIPIDMSIDGAPFIGQPLQISLVGVD